MIDLWKHSGKESAAIKGRSDKAFMGLTDSALVELVNGADSIRFNAGADLLQQPGLAQRMLLIKSGELQLQGDGLLALDVTAGKLLDPFCLRAVKALVAKTEGQLFLLTNAQFNQLHENTQLALLQSGRALAAEWVTRLTDTCAELGCGRQQLSAQALRELHGQ